MKDIKKEREQMIKRYKRWAPLLFAISFMVSLLGIFLIEINGGIKHRFSFYLSTIGFWIIMALLFLTGQKFLNKFFDKKNLNK